jgi:hypothetical protein
LYIFSNRKESKNERREGRNKGGRADTGRRGERKKKEKVITITTGLTISDLFCCFRVSSLKKLNV